MELPRCFPGHGVLGEEHDDDIHPDAEYVWALDPLDGTANFASRLPLWGVSIGLLRRGQPVAAFVWVPVGPDLQPGVYHARLGGGTWWNETGQRLHVAQGDDGRGRIVALPGNAYRRFGFRRPSAGTPRTHRGGSDPRSLGSIAAEMVLVADGVLRLALFVQPKIWDVAAGALLVQEAGGSVLVWRDGGWRPFERFEPMPRPQPRAAPPAALRHWSRPLIVGTPSVVQQATAALVWRPRLPGPLRRLLGT